MPEPLKEVINEVTEYAKGKVKAKLGDLIKTGRQPEKAKFFRSKTAKFFRSKVWKCSLVYRGLRRKIRLDQQAIWRAYHFSLIVFLFVAILEFFYCFNLIVVHFCHIFTFFFDIQNKSTQKGFFKRFGNRF